MTEIAQVGEEVALLGECPVWSEAEQVLYWEDIDGRVIHRYDPSSDTTSSRELTGRPGSSVLTGDPGRLVVATENELVQLDWSSGVTAQLATIEAAETGNRLNDGRCDSAGRFIVGSMWPDASAGKFTGFLYQVDRDGSSRVLEIDVGVPNGTVFDDSRSRMYWADTLHQTIWMWDYDLGTGTRSNRRVFFDYKKHEDVAGFPDGACLDAEGCYWSASVYGWAMTRITPDGAVDRRIDLPVEKPSMPAFGGSDLSVMYITSISDGGTMPDSQPGTDGFEPGCLLAIDAGVRGVPEPLYAG